MEPFLSDLFVALQSIFGDSRVLLMSLTVIMCVFVHRAFRSTQDRDVRSAAVEMFLAAILFISFVWVNESVVPTRSAYLDVIFVSALIGIAGVMVSFVSLKSFHPDLYAREFAQRPAVLGILFLVSFMIGISLYVKSISLMAVSLVIAAILLMFLYRRYLRKQNQG